MVHSRPRLRTGAVLVPLALALAVTTPVAPAGAAVSSTAVHQLSRAELNRLATAPKAPASRSAHEAEASHARDDQKTLPTFSGSFSVGGVTYPYTMLGNAPSSGRSVELKTVVVPLRVVFSGFDQKAVFEPNFAVRNMIKSPIYQEAPFLNGRGQFGDQLQRATFWNQMDKRKQWHVRLADPKVTQTFTITVTPDVAQLDSFNGALLGNVNIDVFDAQLHAILPKLHLAGDETPLFVTQSVTADALGYHDAFLVPDGRGGGQRLQTLMWSSWLDPDQVGTLLGDISTLNHEVAEWLNDPFINNEAPLWAFPPFNQVCGDNPFVEVGDPPGNGPDFDQFPTIESRINGYTYHLQEITLLQWFTRESPSSAYKGWYSFPDPTQITTPSVDCPAV